MFFEKIRRRAGVAGFVTALAVALPVMPASAAVGGQPTPLTITPDFASRVAAAPAQDRSASGEYQVAQSGEISRLLRNSRDARRDSRPQGRRDVRRNVRQNARPDVRRNARQNVRREVRREVRRDVRQDRRDWRRDVRQDRRYDRRHRYNNRWYYNRGGRWYDDSGAWIAAGVIGLAAGAIAGSALAAPNYGYNDTVVVQGNYAPYSAEWYRQCDLKYRSFRASDGTYLGYDGLRHVCRIP